MPPISRLPYGPFPVIIAQGIFRTGEHSHVDMLLVFGHTAAPHGHEARQYLANVRVDAGLIHAQRIGYVVAHGIHRVVGHMAVECPVAGHRNKLDIASLPDTDYFSGLRAPLILRPAPTVRAVTKYCTPCM